MKRQLNVNIELASPDQFIPTLPGWEERSVFVTQEGLTNTNHIAQIARECGVPIVQISPEEMDRLDEGARLALDGSEGTVTIL